MILHKLAEPFFGYTKLLAPIPNLVFLLQVYARGVLWRSPGFIVAHIMVFRTRKRARSHGADALFTIQKRQ